MRRALLALMALALAAAGVTAWAAGLAPAVERAAKGERCVEDVAEMRRNHMRYLKHQRDDTVHGGVRGAKHSLKGCIDCHASAKSGSVAQTPQDFCVACHQYAAVKIDCFECHATKPAAAVAAGVATAGSQP